MNGWKTVGVRAVEVVGLGVEDRRERSPLRGVSRGGARCFVHVVGCVPQTSDRHGLAAFSHVKKE